MADELFLGILFRWLHIIPALLVVGGLFFMRIILPFGLDGVEEPKRSELLLRCRRGFKMLVHVCILLLLISGIFNSFRLWTQYNLNPALLHGLWGAHVILGLIAIGVSVWLLAGGTLRASHRQFAIMNLVLLIVLAAVASTLKQVREAKAAAAAGPAITIEVTE